MYWENSIRHEDEICVTICIALFGFFLYFLPERIDLIALSILMLSIIILEVIDGNEKIVKFLKGLSYVFVIFNFFISILN